MSIDIDKIYCEHIERKSVERRKELAKDKIQDVNTYRASSSGMCARKLYYESVLRLEPTEKIKDGTRRIFRLGEILHEDIQNAVLTHVVSKRKEPKENI